MGWEDRSYYREGRSGGGAAGPLNWMLYGSVPLFTAFGIRVRAHASLVIICVLILLLGFGNFGSTITARVESVTALFLVILLHEFGHCFGARWTGGHAEEIVMTPLGGLAMVMARRRPWPTFVTVAAGPLVNVIICIVCGILVYASFGFVPLGPSGFQRAVGSSHNETLLTVGWYAFWIYGISYALLVFNLIPVFPLDGGQLLQSILWKPLGYYRSMIITLNVGLVGSVLMFAVGLATFGSIGGGFLLIIIAVNCFLACFRTRAMMKAEGPWAFTEEDAGGGDYGALAYGASGGYPESPARTKTKSPGWFAKAKANKVARAVKEEAAEQDQIDEILAKVSAQGMQSLTSREKRALQRATENQRRRDLEMRRPRT